MSKLTDEQLNRVRKDFKRLDANDDKKVTVKEFTATMEPYFTAEEIAQALEKLNTDANDEISWDEYLAEYQKDLDRPASDA